MVRLRFIDPVRIRRMGWAEIWQGMTKGQVPQFDVGLRRDLARSRVTCDREFKDEMR